MKKSSNQQQVGVQLDLIAKKRKEMSSAERVQLLQRRLTLKAKQEKNFGFYILYDKIFLPYILEEAWKRVKENHGQPGVDNVTIEMIEQRGVSKFLKELSEELRQQIYQPSAVKRVMIEKPGGGERPLGIPTVRDRVAQTACMLVIEPIFEADFEEHSYGFRPERSAKDAMAKVKEHLKTGKSLVYDADLSKYFDTIPHDKLMIALKERIKDQRVLKLITSWLKAVVHDDGRNLGGKNKTGTPQGGVISPLLSNLYLHLLDRIISKATSLFARLGVSMVRYADDFVLLGRTLPEQVVTYLKALLTRMELKLNEEKSKQVNARQTPFRFLGFTIRYDKDLFDPSGRRRYWNIVPSDKSITRIRGKLSDALSKMGHYAPDHLVEELNPIIRGWLNYYDVPGVTYAAMAKRDLTHYLSLKLLRYFNRKSQRKSRLYRTHAFELLVTRYGLIDPRRYTAR